MQPDPVEKKTDPIGKKTDPVVRGGAHVWCSCVHARVIFSIVFFFIHKSSFLAAHEQGTTNKNAPSLIGNQSGY